MKETTTTTVIILTVTVTVTVMLKITARAIQCNTKQQLTIVKFINERMTFWSE